MVNYIQRMLVLIHLLTASEYGQVFNHNPVTWMY